MPRKKSRPDQAGDRISYRDLRNTPGRVWERLRNDEPLTLIADGEAKAVLLPVADGDARGTYEAYERGRAMLAASRLRRAAKAGSGGRLTLSAINEVIRKTRAARNRGKSRG
jgi:hypothetical protein